MIDTQNAASVALLAASESDGLAALGTAGMFLSDELVLVWVGGILGPWWFHLRKRYIPLGLVQSFLRAH